MSGTLYTGVAGNASLAAPAQATVPIDGDNDNGATFSVGMQKLADYIEALRNAIPTSAFSESFDGATFPPTGANWATPSPRFATDLAWVRTTTNPIAGTASASAPVPQGTTTNSSLGLTISLASPSRISFLFALNCNNNQGDHLDFYVDGVLTMQESTITSNTLIGSMFKTDLLREGPHTFDWRFVRGGSASVGSEECKIDTVEIIPEETWRGDPTRVYLFDDGFSPVSNAATTIAVNSGTGVWGYITGANAGTYRGNNCGTGALGFVGATLLATPATAAGDYAQAFTLSIAQAPGASPTFLEYRINIPALSANEVIEVGWMDGAAPAGTNFLGWVFDGTLGAASTLRWRSIIASAATTADSNVASAAGAWFRLGICCATVRGVTGAVFLKDGKALPGAASVPPYLVAPTSTSLNPSWRCRSVTGAFAAQLGLDSFRQLMLRP